MSAPITGAKVAALRLWRWHPRLSARLPGSKGGCSFALQAGSDSRVVQELHDLSAEPDPDDPLLPGWLRHLLMDRVGPVDLVWFDGTWRVVESDSGTRLGAGPTELHALVGALRRVA